MISSTGKSNSSSSSPGRRSTAGRSPGISTDWGCRSSRNGSRPTTVRCRPRGRDELKNPLSPALVRDELKNKWLPQANLRQINQFVYGPKPSLESKLLLESGQVADFLKGWHIQVDPVEVRLKIDGLVSWNVWRGWRWMFGSGVFPAVVFLALLLLVPESPRWLIKHERRGEALAILTRVDGQPFAQMELRAIDEWIAAESGRLSELWEPWMRGVLLLGVALAVLQQVTGINVIFYFAPKIFQGLGAGADTAMLQAVVVGAVNLAFTVLAVAVVDRGRKPLMIIGAIGMGVSLTALGLAAYWQLFHWWSLVFVLSYIACFAMSVGPVTWVILSEIFPTKVRGRAMGLATICLWLANYAVSQTFPMMDADPALLALSSRLALLGLCGLLRRPVRRRLALGARDQGQIARGDRTRLAAATMSGRREGTKCFSA